MTAQDLVLPARPARPAPAPHSSRPGGVGTVLVFGGYGGFGARLSRRLAAAGCDVVVAGRRFEAAADFCRAHPACRPLRADRSAAVGPLLRDVRPGLVIDAAGPFQRSGYGVPEACIAAGIPYLDLADGRGFVAGIGALDAAAKAAGVAVLSGASSVPALSGAVARALARGMESVSAVEMALSASNRATAGSSVAAAILSYAGRPVPLWRGRRWAAGVGWQELRREAFATGDGSPPLRRWVALAAVPDLDLLPGRLPGRPAVSFRAGTDSAAQTLALWLLSWPVRLGVVASLGGLARWLLPLQRLTAPWGSDRSGASDRSGLVVRLFGLAGGRRVERRWTLAAADGHGPEVPVLAAAILAGRMLAGRVAPGARDAGSALELRDFAPHFAGLSIREERREIARSEPLLARIMGARFSGLAPSLAALHGVLRDGGAAGSVAVERGRHPVARLVAALLRLPAEGEHALHASCSERRGVERWTLDVAGRRHPSAWSRDGGRLALRRGPVSGRFDLAREEGGGLCTVLRGWSVGRLPLPVALAPCRGFREWDDGGAVRFAVAFALPLVGTLARCEGSLRPA